MPSNIAEVCRYYGKLCESTGGADEYACNSQQCCEDFNSDGRYGSYESAMCIRECLISDDMLFFKISDLSYHVLTDLRFIAHIHCYAMCPGGKLIGIMVYIKGLPDSCSESKKIFDNSIEKDLSSFSSTLRKLEELFK
ncbi:hypothetical protein [Candidatus Magnetominusculus dajiuhuensis]|uniref:hypothetical protein n=1 Tax=Candidatus Magnetominusculus dajiuhuensis TaxID=3137712 RepID=UPI003B4355C7